MSFKEKAWNRFEKFMDFGSNHYTDNYIDAEDYHQHHRNPGGGVGLGLVVMVFPELVYLYNAKQNVAMGLTGIGLFLLGVVLDLLLIYRPIMKRYPETKKKVDHYNAFLELVIFVILLLLTILRYKLGWYLK